MFGIECASGDTFMSPPSSDSPTPLVTMSPMHVPDPVISLAIRPISRDNANFSKALSRFQREDPTFRVNVDSESGETVISGMGELHLEIYMERMKREYGCPCTAGKPQVAFRETIAQRATFDYTHKKQSGGAGQFARVAGYIEPVSDWYGAVASEDSELGRFQNHFVNEVEGGTVPTEFIPACEKGFVEAANRGWVIGHPVVGVKFVLQDGAAHVVDSNEFSFRTAAIQGFRQAIARARPLLLEPIMKVTITVPSEFQGAVLGTVNKRKGVIVDTEGDCESNGIASNDDGDPNTTLTIVAEVALNNMFGYSTELRSATQGKGEFTMEYKTYAPVPSATQQELITEHQKKLNQSSTTTSSK